MKQKTEGVHLWLLLFKAYRSIELIDRKSIRSLGFNSHSDFVVLEILYHKGAMPVSAIGEKIMLTSGSITTAIHRAEKEGLVTREPDPDDGRVVLVHLSSKGRKRIEGAFAEHAKNFDPVFEGFSQQDRQDMARLLKKAGFAAKALSM